MHTVKGTIKRPDWYGCLKDLATPDDPQTARRRLPPEADEDSWRLAFGEPYKADFHKIVESKGYRRLADKTQVITRAVNSDGSSFEMTPHIRTRLSHTCDVMGMASTLAIALGLNESLVLAGAAGHDLGHLPLGHDSEKFFKRLGQNVRHEVFGVYLAQFIERRKFGGLNLSLPTLKIILRHSRGGAALACGTEMSQEERLVLYADKFSYISADIFDIFVKFRRTKISDQLGQQLDQHWQEVSQLLRSFTSDNSLPNQRNLQKYWGLALGEESARKKYVSFEDSDTARRFNRLRALMMDAYPLVSYCLVAGWSAMERAFELLSNLAHERGIAPVILYALLCDQELLEISRIPAFSNSIPKELINRTSLADILPYLSNMELPSIDQPLLDW